MVRVVPLPPLGADWFDGAGELAVAGANLFALVRALDEQARERGRAGFAKLAEDRLAFAVDGDLVEDWSVPLGPDSEVLIVPKIAGGQSAS